MKAFQSPPPRIDRADVPLPTLEQQVRDLVARQRAAVAEVPPGRHLQHLIRPATTTPEETK